MSTPLIDLAESREQLQALLSRSKQPLPKAELIDLVMRVTRDTDWPTRRAALDAVLRRVQAAVREELVVRKGPRGRALYGDYRVGRADVPKSRHRPYRTQLHSRAPFRGSCDCPDFLKSGLGLCKHLAAVWSHTLDRPTPKARPSAGDPDPCLRWDPVVPWTGPARPGDRLFLEGALARPLRGFRGGPLPPANAQTGERRKLLRLVAQRVEDGTIEAEPAAVAVLADDLERLERRLDGAKDAERAAKHLRRLSRTLYPYQQEGVRRLLTDRRLLLGDDMGLGKTTQAIAACHALFQMKRVTRGLLVVPAPLKSQWAREWSDSGATAPIEVVEGRPDERAEQYAMLERGFLVIGYEQLIRDVELVRAFDPELVILDEAQRIKNWATRTAAAVKALTPEWRFVLTGTPLENRLDELASILDWVDDAALAPKWRLSPWHTLWSKAERPEALGARHLGTLRARIEPCVVRRVRHDVLNQLPERRDIRVPITLTDGQRAAHDELTMPIVQLLQQAQRRPLTQAQFLRLMTLLAQQRIISNGLVLRDFDDEWPDLRTQSPRESRLLGLQAPKLQELRRLVEELVVDQGRRVVIFSQWRRMLLLAHWATADILAAGGYRSVFFTGHETQRTRTKNVVEFHDDPDVRVMFLTDAGGVGLNLQRAANACINIELPWNPAVLEQRIGRIHRIGQADPIDVFFLVADSGIESRIAGSVGRKKALFDGLFDGATDLVTYDEAGGFLADVHRLVGDDGGASRAKPEPAAADVEDLDGVTDGDEATGEDGASAIVGDAEVAMAGDDLAEKEDVGDPGAAASDDAAAEPPTAARLSTSATRKSAASTSATNGDRVRQLFDGVRVEKRPDGGLTLDADPGAADQLAALLEGLAGMLRGGR